MTRILYVSLKFLAISLLIVGCKGGGNDMTSDSNGLEVDTINSVPVPAEPDLGINNMTLAGIDINENGIRDDVERVIATEFGDNTVKYQEAKSLAKAEQRLIVNASPEDNELHTKVSICNSLSEVELLKITEALLNTEERAISYATMTAGTVIQGGNLCQ